MTQNIYDDKQFFAGYSALRRSIEGLEGAPEWPSLRALLPVLSGAKVVDLGCGFGWFCRWARQNGASEVLGIDVSEKMLMRARADTGDDAIAYERADMERLVLPAGHFDLAYSSLALHYIVGLEQLTTTVHRALLPGGRFIFSVEHPIFTAPRQPDWRIDPDGRKFWPVDHYLAEGPRSTDWLVKGVIKQHRTIGTYIGLLIGAGFTILNVEEWGPSKAQIASFPALANERERPPFLLVAAERR